jgi:phage N-6-adenine-methyltransferase
MKKPLSSKQVIDAIIALHPEMEGEIIEAFGPNSKITKGMFSSKTDEWATPPYVFDKLNDEFKFTLDPCATDQNHKCQKYFTKDKNGLKQLWGNHRVFMNPPYGRDITLWMRKAYEESLRGAMVVCLIPARTDTAWWHDYSMKGEIRFVRGRIGFIKNDDGGKPSVAKAPFPSAIIVFGNEKRKVSSYSFSMTGKIQSKLM